jgi:hypothetical protein
MTVVKKRTNRGVKERTTSVDEHPPGQPEAWYATEVPPIVAGLQASRAISTATAADAWRLIDEGSYDRALAVALREGA